MNLTLAPDPRRVIVKLFVPGTQASEVRTRASAIVGRIRRLDEEETRRLLQQTSRIFGGRHRDLEATFAQHYALVRQWVLPDDELSPAARLLVGAHFTHEYAVEAAALCNPSMVAHPDQSGLAPGQLRAVVSLRQIGEEHISSIGFATAILGPPDNAVDASPPRGASARTALTIGDRSGPLMTGRRDSATRDTLEQLGGTVADSYTVTFAAETRLDQRVLWPAAPSERNGMEDARFVIFTEDDGSASYQATYTAYDGQHIGMRLLRSDDLLRFDVAPLRGPAVASKGMALFPRTVSGRYLALCRTDGETIGLTTRDDDHQWQAPVTLHPPSHSWGLIQVGNCGSPLETEAGWLVLTHGVGPMRRYAMSAMLLDLHEPQRVIGMLPGMLLAPEEDERDGYVPNVVYSCGALLHDGTLWLPYGASDARVGFARISLDTLTRALRAP